VTPLATDHRYNSCIPQLTPDVGLLLNLAAVLLLGHFLRKYSQTGGRFAFGMAAAGGVALVTSVFTLIPLRAGFRAASSDEEQIFYMLSELVFYGCALAALVAIVRVLLRRQIRWSVAVPLLASAVAAWLALDVSMPKGEELFLEWAVLVLLMIALLRAAFAAVAPPDRGAATARFGFIGACAMFVLAWKWIPLARDGVGAHDTLDPYTVIVAVLLYVDAFVAWLAGGPPAGLVVFLRRFGKTELNRALARAARRRRGTKRFRMITLDDRDFTPLSGGRSALSITAAALIPLTAFAFVVMNASSNAVAELALYELAERVARTLLLIGAAVCLVPTILILGWAFWRSWAKRRQSVTSTTQIDRLISSLTKKTTWWLRARTLSNPRAVVVTTAHELWQQTVLALMRAADVVVIDLSEVSENVQWELDRLREEFPSKAVILLPTTSPPPGSSNMRIVPYHSFAELEKLQISPLAGG